MIFGWSKDRVNKKAACDTEEGFMRREFTKTGLLLIVVETGAGARQATLSPADALALARDIEREYGGRRE